MLELTPYFYYCLNDDKKEPIDKVIAYSEENAISYFAERKQIEESVFISLYVVEIYGENKSK